MSVDDRLRTGLTANATALREPDVEHLLGKALAAHRRRRALRRAGLAGLAAAACAAVVLPMVWNANTAPKPPAGTAP